MRYKAPQKTVDGSLLRAAREYFGLSRARLGVMIGVGGATIYRREKNMIQASYEAWLALCKALGLPQDWKPVAPPRVEIDPETEAKRAKIRENVRRFRERERQKLDLNSAP